MIKRLKSSNLNKTFRYLKKNGLKQTFYAVWERTLEAPVSGLAPYEALDEKTLYEQVWQGKGFHTRFSILVPAYETKEEYLRAMLDSVLAQTYGNFELILADASSSAQVEKVAASYQDNRIKYQRLEQNRGIAGNTEQALQYASGDYAALLDHDDVLTPDALYEMAACIEKYEKSGQELLLLYSDEDKLDGESGHYFEENRKQKFNLDLILSNNYICHFLVMKREIMQELGLRSAYDGAQDYDLILRAVSKMLKSLTGRNQDDVSFRKLPIAHIPKILYHWRCHPQSTAENPQSKRYAYEAGKRAVEDFLREQGWNGRVMHMRHLGFYRVEYQPSLLANRPEVAIVGGRLLDKRNRVVGGIYEMDGTPLYFGLHKEFSGYMNRACLIQEADVVDVRCMKISEAAEKVLEELTGCPCRKNPETGYFFWREVLGDDTDYLALSRRLCDRIRRMGYDIVWDPAMTERLK